MKKVLSLVAVAVAVVMAATVCGEDPVPDPENSIVQCFQPVRGDTLILVCPAWGCSAWRTYLDVTLIDATGLPVPGQPVQMVFTDPVVCGPVNSGITNASGFVRLSIQAGVDATAGDQPRVSSGYTVKGGWAQVIIRTGVTSIMSADCDCNLIVDAGDFSMFATGWLKSGGSLRGDLNDDKIVDALDFSGWASHWLHQ